MPRPIGYKVREHSGVQYYIEDGAVQSVVPETAHFGFSYWALMIPPFKPEDMLQLGCGAHTISKLINKVWGDTDLTCDEGRDAFQFAKELRGDSRIFDYIIVDVYNGGTPHPNVFEDDFVDDIAALSRGLVAINASETNAGKWQRYLRSFDNVLEKRLNNNKVTFLSRKGFMRQYFAILPEG